MISCQELFEFVSDYVEARLPAAEAHEFERHLGRCPACQRYLESFRRTLELARAAGEASPSAQAAAALPEELVQAVLRARKAAP